MLLVNYSFFLRHPELFHSFVKSRLPSVVFHTNAIPQEHEGLFDAQVYGANITPQKVLDHLSHSSLPVLAVLDFPDSAYVNLDPSPLIHPGNLNYV